MLKKSTKAYLLRNCREDIGGRWVVVTGANSGIGFRAAEELLELGACVAMACRNAGKAAEARDRLLSDHPGARIRVYCMDLGSRSSIASFAAALEADGLDVHAFVNNAGVFRVSGRTSDGLEVVEGTNYVGTYLLTQAVLPYLRTLPHRVKLINTSSIIYKSGSVDYSDFYRERSGAGTFRIYGQSKLLVTRWSLMLDRSLEGTNVSVYMNHPGISITPIASKAYGDWVFRIGRPFIGIFQSAEKSALAIPYIITNDVPSGSLYGPDGFLDGWGLPRRNRLLRKAYEGWDELAEFNKTLI